MESWSHGNKAQPSLLDISVCIRSRECGLIRDVIPYYQSIARFLSRVHGVTQMLLTGVGTLEISPGNQSTAQLLATLQQLPLSCDHRVIALFENHIDQMIFTSARHRIDSQSEPDLCFITLSTAKFVRPCSRIKLYLANIPAPDVPSLRSKH
jgi:hypothetical protein